jgi:hypothetical protein
MSLPLAWIDRIFEKMTVTYGASFLNRWRDMEAEAMNDVKSDWMHELSAFRAAPHAIAFALENLPERAPNVIEFKNLCRQAPSIEAPQLPAPKANPEVVAQVIAGLQKTQGLPKVDHKAWAQRILDDVAAGAKRTPTVIAMARRAVGSEV